MLSVIIPHLNQPDFLDRCLASLMAQDGAVPAFEIIVVDNGSHDMPQAVCDAYPAVRLIAEPEPGPGPARNAGVAAANGDILAFIDADCLADPGWLARIENYFATNPEAHILGGDVFIAREDAASATLLEAYESIYAYRMKEYIAKQGFTGTGNLAVRAATMAKVGGFGGLHLAEDRDWGQRAGRAGFATTYVEGMVVYHPARKTFDELRQKWDRHVAHDCVRMQEKSFWRLRWLARTALVAASPAGEIPKILTSPRVSGASERAKAFAGMLWTRLYRARRMLQLVIGGDPEAMSGAWNRG